MDLKKLSENLGLEEEEYIELLELLIDTGRADLDKLQGAITSGNMDEAGKAAHSLKGAAANLGLTGISEAARKVEEQARNALVSGVAEAARSLVGEFEAVAQLARS
jgi:HPt (histidine-containing phosphotransfer) domain-containing protein